MRFALAQLRKLAMPYSYEEELDLTPDLVGFEDILAVKPAHVQAVLNEISNDKYAINMKISIDLTLQCSITLKEVPYSINTSIDEVYSVTDDTGSDAYLIENQTLDTKEAILQAIIINKPMKVVSPGAEFKDDDIDEDDSDKINPAFASLADLLK